MKCLIIGGNRFVGLRLSLLLEQLPGMDLHILNRTGQAPHCRWATVYKGDRRRLATTHLEREWDVIFDFACYNQAEALSSVDFFQSVGRYVFISSASVYDFGSDLREEDFAPSSWDLTTAPVTDPAHSYQDGKRRSEAVFAQQAQFPVTSVRFPFVLGPDDYTDRLNFHVERAVRGEPVFVPNVQVSTSMIHSADAAGALHWLMDQSISGPLNVASPKPITLNHLFGQIQLITGHKLPLTTTETADNHSPYGRGEDLVLNVDRLQQAGFHPRPILEWLPELIGPPQADGPKGFVH